MRRPRSGSGSAAARPAASGAGAKDKSKAPDKDKAANNRRGGAGGAKADEEAAADGARSDRSRPPPRQRRKRRERRRISPTVAWTVLIALIAFLYIGYWAFGAMTLKSGLEAAIARQRAEGIAIVHGPAEVGGFPWRIAATLSDVSARASPARGGWTWQTESLTIAVSPLQPTVLRSDLAEAPHRLTLPATTAGPLALTAAAETADVSATLTTQGRLRALSIDLAEASLAPAVGPGHTLERLTLNYAYKPLWDPDPDDVTHTVALDLAGLTLAPDLGLPLGRAVTRARLDARVLGKLPHDRPPEDAFKAWRDNGGRLRLDTLTVTWEPMRLAAAGSLRLDEAMQPDGTLNARISGFMRAIDTLHEQALVRGRDATMAKVLLGGMARPAPDGTRRLEVALVVRDSALWAGPVRLMALPRLPWGPPPGSLGAEGLRPGFSIDRQGNIVPN